MFIVALLVALAPPGTPREMMPFPGNQWTWNGVVARGASLEIRGVTGDIHAVPADDGRVGVTATIEDGSEVDIRVDETSTGITVCAVRRGADVCAAESAGAPGVRVDYRLRVPQGVNLVAKTVNGAIEAESLAGDVHATTVNGPVVISTSGTAEASTVNGSIIARLLRPFWRKPPQFSAVNGRISVVLPRDVKAGIRAETRNGKIVQQLSAFRGDATEQKLDGTAGQGPSAGAPLVIRTVNGLIELKQTS